MLEYQKTLNTIRDATDPWGTLANAVVEQTVDDYRRNMTRMLKRGMSMSNMELAAVRRNIFECRHFFETAWGDLLSHGLAAVIWERIQSEFADDLAEFETRLPYMQKHRRKLERRRRAAFVRRLKNKQRHKKQRAFRRQVAVVINAIEEASR